MLPLDGIRIVDFSRLLPGPLATYFLAQLGAEIYKVESPANIDYMRSFPPMADEDSSYYHYINAQKKSLLLDFVADKERLLQLIAESDVLIEQFRPGMMKKFGFDYDTLREINPALIYISLTGYGQGNAMSRFGGHDLNFMAMSGMLSLNKGADGVPTLPSFQMGDVAGGAYSVINTVSLALLLRQKTGIGNSYDIGMTDTLLPVAAMYFAQHQFNKDGSTPFMIDGTLANYAVYACKDQRHIAFAALEPKFWFSFCTKINQPDWTSRSFDPEMKATLTDFFKTKNRDEWVSFFADDDICLSPILHAEEIFTHPYYIDRDSFSTLTIGGETMYVLNFPVKGFPIKKPVVCAEKTGQSNGE